MMAPTAYSQVAEQWIRVSFIIIFALILVPAGFSLYAVGRGAFVASIIGNTFGMMILLIIFFRYRRKNNIRFVFPRADGWAVAKAVLFEGTAICISSLTLLFFQMADAFQILSNLLSFGMEMGVAQTVKGVYDRGLPLLQVGLVAATSLSLSTVPLIASMRRKGQAFPGQIGLALKIGISIGAAASVGLIMIMEHVNIMLFENNAGTPVLQILPYPYFLPPLVQPLLRFYRGWAVFIFPH